MKEHFKYSIRTGLSVRAAAFGFIFLMDLVFIVLGSTVAPFKALMITAVALGGVAIGAMTVFNVISDISIARRMFAAPGAYLYSLTPAPRWKILLASVVTISLMDIITMTVVIVGEVWLSLVLAGESIARIIGDVIRGNVSGSSTVIWSFILLIIAGYTLIIMIILFTITARKSWFFNLPAAGLLSVILALGCFYAESLLQLLLAPFGTIERYGFLVSINLAGRFAIPAYALLILVEAFGLFVLTSRLMEKRMNI